MPVINATPRRMGRDVVTEVTDSVGATDVTYTYLDLNPQETIKIQNLSSVKLLVSVGSQSNIEVEGYKDVEIVTEPFTLFKIRAQLEQGSFRMVSSYKDVDEEDEKNLYSLIKDLLAKRPTGRDKIVCIGDSITQGGSQSRSYPLWLSYYTQSQVINKGISGNKLTDVIARLTVDAINLKPGTCVIMCGTNDVAGDTLVNITTNIASITDSLLNNGITPIWGTIPPRNDSPSLNVPIRKVNYWILNHCVSRGISCVDFYKVIADPSTGLPKPGILLPDNLHPNVTGMIAIAKEVAKVVPAASRDIPWRIAGGDAEILVPNVAFLNDSNNNGLADSWETLGNGGGLLSWSLEKHPQDGKWQVVRKQAGATPQTGGIRCPLTLTVGVTYRVEADIEFSCVPAASGDDPYVLVYVEFYDSVGASISFTFVLNETHIQNIEKTRVSADITVPANMVTTKIIAQCRATGTFTQRLGRVKITELYSTP